MSEQIPDDVQFMISVPQALHVTEDGPKLEVDTYGISTVKMSGER